MLVLILDKRVELESKSEAEMIDFIREVMRRRLYLEFAAESMFDFLTRTHCHYAPVVAQRKLDAPWLMQSFPEVKELISCGEVNLTQLGMLASAFRQKPTPLKIQHALLESIRGHDFQNTCFEIEFKKSNIS